MRKVMNNCFLAIILGMLIPNVAQAGLVLSGKSVADEWEFVGSPRSLGFYVRGSGHFNCDLYRISFLIDSSNDPLITSFTDTGWMAGDAALGIGGFILNQANPLSEANDRMVAKYGTSISMFLASTETTPPADGNMSFSNENSGTDGIESGVNAGESSNPSPRQDDLICNYDGTSAINNGWSMASRKIIQAGLDFSIKSEMKSALAINGHPIGISERIIRPIEDIFRPDFDTDAYHLYQAAGVALMDQIAGAR